MEIGSKEWQNLIIDGARKLGIEIDAGIAALFSIHARELIHWNRKINLTAITQPGEIAIQHFLDSIVPAEFIPESARMLDIGSGGGFPGIPLKILKPSISVLLIDAVRKKVNFLKHVLRVLNLEDVEALHLRSEHLRKDPGGINCFDVVISRALIDLSSFVKNALPLLAEQGKLIAMKGLVSGKELDRMRANIHQDSHLLEIKNYKLPSMNALRSIVVIHKKRSKTGTAARSDSGISLQAE